jgi:hypothetical protein
MSFNLSEVIHLLSTIDDLLSMTEYPYVISSSTGYDFREDREDEFIQFTFPLKNGISRVKLYNSGGVMVYESKSGEVLKTIVFDDRNIFALNGSFKKGFKQIREFDRQNASTIQANNTTIDRASFGLAEVN